MITELILTGFGGLGVGAGAALLISKLCCTKADTGIKTKFVTNISCCKSGGTIEADGTDGVMIDEVPTNLESVVVSNDNENKEAATCM